MSAVDLALPRLKEEEEFRAQLYDDRTGKTVIIDSHYTIGYGFRVMAGLSKYAASALVTAQADECHLALSVYAWYEQLDEVRQSVCLDIAFNDGIHGLLGFPSMIEAIKKQDWESACRECHVQNPGLASRYEKLAQILRTGIDV